MAYYKYCMMKARIGRKVYCDYMSFYQINLNNSN